MENKLTALECLNHLKPLAPQHWNMMSGLQSAWPVKMRVYRSQNGTTGAHRIQNATGNVK